MKAVVTLSSSVAQMGRVSEAARALDTPLAPFDQFQFAYKVSKTGLNQGAPVLPRVSRFRLPLAKGGWALKSLCRGPAPLQPGRPRRRCRSPGLFHVMQVMCRWKLAHHRPPCHARSPVLRSPSRSRCADRFRATPAVTVQLANELKGEGFTFIAIHPGGRSIGCCPRPAHAVFPPLRRPCEHTHGACAALETRRAQRQMTHLRSSYASLLSIVRLHAGTVDTDILAEVRSGGTELDALLKGRAVRAVRLTLPSHLITEPHVLRQTLAVCTYINSCKLPPLSLGSLRKHRNGGRLPYVTISKQRRVCHML